MTGIPYRPANQLEHKLYQEITQPLADWLEQQTGPILQPGPAATRLIQAVHAQLEALGMQATPDGLFIREEPDILRETHPAELICLITHLWQEAWLQIMGKAKRRHAYFQ